MEFWTTFVPGGMPRERIRSPRTGEFYFGAFGEFSSGSYSAQDPADDGDRRRVSAGRERSGGRDERSVPPQELRSAARRAQLQRQADDRRGGRGVRGEQARARQASRDQGPIRPDAEGVRRKRGRSGHMGRDQRLGRLQRDRESQGGGGRRRPAHEVLDWIHRVFANLKRWSLGFLHGFRRKHLDWQLVEWSFRWN